MSVDYAKVIEKLQKGTGLNEEEQRFINAKLEAQKKAELSAKKAQAKMNLLLAYARAHYEPTEVEVEAEVGRMLANKKA